MIKNFCKFVSRLGLGLAAVATAPLASAAIVTGSWDPALPDPPFDNLGWSTTINISVLPQCTRDDGTTNGLLLNYKLFGYNFRCEGRLPSGELPFDILSAQIGIYDLVTMRYIDVLTFDPDHFIPAAVEIDPGEGEGEVVISYLLSLNDSNAVRGTAGVERTEDFVFKLDLPGAAPAIKFKAFGGSGGFTTGTEVPTQTQFAINPDSALQDVLAATRLEVGDSVFTGQIPEPGSLALALLALVAAGATAHRRRSSTAAI